MATVTEQIILQVKADNSEAITQMSKLTQETTKLKDENAKLAKQNKENEKALKDLTAAGKTNTDEYKKLEAEISKNNASIETNKSAVKSLTTEYNSYQKQLTANITMQKANEGSLNQLGAELTKLNAEYARMSKTEKETTDQGKALKASIEEKSAAYKEEQMAIGNTYVNVGNYQAAMEGALAKQSPMIAGLLNMSKAAKETGVSFGQTLVNSLKSVGQAMLKLLANPLVAALAVIVLLLMGIVKVIKSNEEQMQRLNAIMAPFKKLLDGVLNVLQLMVDGVLSFIEFIMKGIGLVMKLLESLPLVGDAMKDINDATRESIQLEKDKAALIDQNRKNLVTLAEIERDISRLKVQSMDRENFTAEQRLEFLRQANTLTEQKLKLQQAAVAEELRIALIEAARNKNSAEINDKIAQLKAQQILLERDYFNALKENQEKITGFLLAEEAARKTAADARIAKAKEYAAIALEAEKRIRDLTIALMREGLAQEKALLKAKYDDEVKAVKGTKTQQVQIKKLLEQQYLTDQAALEAKYAQESYDKTLAKIREEIEIKIAINKEGSDARLTAELQRLELERTAALESAKTTGVSISLVNQEFDLLRLKAIADNEEQAKQIRLAAYQTAVDEQQARFELELAQLYGNDLAKAELEISIEQQKLDKLLAMDAQNKKELGLTEVEYALLVQQQRNKVTEAIDKTTAAQQANFEQMQQGLFTVGKAIGAILTSVAGNQEEYGAFAKAAALFQIGLQSAESIAAAIAGATKAAASTGPAAPYVVAGYIASMVATVTAAMFSAYDVINAQNNPSAPSFATGGLVRGPGSATSDSIAANLSNGESVMTASTTSMFAPLLSGLNQLGGGVPIHIQGVVMQSEGEEMLARAFAAGVASLPNPVVSVEEIERVNRRVKVLENLRS
jgi:hypothetical protein